MYNVSVKIKRRNSVEADKRMPLYIQIIYRREVRKILLPYRLSENEWQPRSEEVAIPEGTGQERSEKLRTICKQLTRYHHSVCSVISRMEKKNPFSVDEIVAACREHLKASVLTNYVDQLADKFTTDGKEATARHCRSTLNAFMRYCNNEEIRIDEIDAVMLKDFETYLYSTGICDNSVSFYMRTLRTIRNRAVADNLVDSSPGLFAEVNTRIEKTRKRAVKEKMLQSIITLQLLSPELILARDLFLFSYYTRGMAFIDLAHLRRENIKRDRIIYTRHKTGEQLQIRLLPVMKSLIAAYRRTGSPYLFPILKSTMPTRVEYENALRLQNKRLKKVGKLVGIDDLSTYVARHSWASIAAVKGISEELISKGMGHTSVKTTHIYMAFWEDLALDRANEIVISGKRCNSRSVYRTGG